MYGIWTQFLQVITKSSYKNSNGSGVQILFSTWSHFKEKVKTIFVCDIDNQYTKHVYAFKGIESLYLNPNLQ